MQGAFDGTPRVVLVDLDGGAMIEAGSHQLLRLVGTVEIESILVSDENHSVLASVNYGSGLVPTEFTLHQNYPNPFNPTTEIKFNLPSATDVNLEIYNIIGGKVATLVDSYLEAGEHTVTWDGRDAASGVYLYRLEAGEFVATKKMVLLK